MKSMNEITDYTNILINSYELIISSGGTKGIALIGGLNELNKYYPIKNIKYYTGCSIGAIICLLINIGYDINELNDIIFKINFGNFQDIKFINLIEKCGLDEGIKFTNFLKALIINKNFSSGITFNELYEQTNKVLTVTVTNITKGIAEYHNYLNTPNLSIVLSLRMSSNIPILFAPILYNNCYYVDGALLDPFPYYYNKNTKKIGLWLFEKYEFNFLKNIDSNFVNNIDNSINYIIDLLKIIHVNYIKKHYKKIPNNVIYIDFDFNRKSFENFDLTDEERVKMYNIGSRKCILFLNRKNKKQRKRYLALKYFKLWRSKLRFPHLS
jgi:hypothetical protein